HDQEEAMGMASRIALMHDGRIVQVGSPRELYEAPVSRYVADFFGTANLFTGEVVHAARGEADAGSHAAGASLPGRGGGEAAWGHGVVVMVPYEQGPLSHPASAAAT